MKSQKFEVNTQRNKNGLWKNAEFNTSKEAELCAAFWVDVMNAFNVNWNGVIGSAEAQTVWVVKNGQRK